MATASKQSKTTVTITGVTLDLTLEESVALRDFLGYRAVDRGDQYKDRSVKLTDGIYFAIRDALGF